MTSVCEGCRGSGTNWDCEGEREGEYCTCESCTGSQVCQECGGDEQAAQDDRSSVWRALVAAATQRGDLPCPYGTDECTTVDGHFYHGDCARSERRVIAREVMEDRTRDAAGRE